MLSDGDHDGGGISARVGLLVPVDLEVEPGRELVVGRDARCDVVINDPTVSRRHMRLFWEHERLFVEDLGSSGGTFLDGSRVTLAELSTGSRLRLGPRAECVVSAPTPSSLFRASSGGQHGVGQLQVMLDVARALNVATVVGEVLDVVLEAAVGLMEADQGCVALLEADGSRRVAAARPAELEASHWGETSSLVHRAIGERRTVMSDGVSLDSSIVGRGFTSGVATPLMVARRPMGLSQDASFVATVEVIGALLVERRAGAVFSPDQLAVFESLAADAAMAIDGARLYRESREKAQIEHEMELARTIQTAMLRRPPIVSFAEVYASSTAARTVGGDLYHTGLRNDGSLFLTLGDVSGKGVAAALIMAMVQGLLEFANDLQLPLHELPSVLDRSLGAYNPGNRFVTLVTALLRPDGSLLLVNAGHCPVAHVGAKGSVEMTDVDGPVLGLLPAARWTIQKRRLDPGDTLVFYSDGIPESFSDQGCEFGEEGLRDALSAAAGVGPEALAEAILTATSEHRGGAEADDDVTLLIVRFNG